uniref:TonB-dependent receptor plug domain-containing protein n=1 Tax=uncultured Sphingobium sp. TaxID=316087 RepID=UPI00261A7C43
MRLVQALAGLMLLCCSTLPTRANPPPDRILDQRHRFDIHVQPLSGALRQLSSQTGVRILFPYEEVSAIRSRRVEGWMTTGQALQKLLAGTQLRMTQTSAGVIALAAPSRATARQSPLSFQLAQAASAPASGPVTDVTPIIVTGTRLVTRTVADSMVPIDILSAHAMEANGRQSVRDLLGALVPAISVSNSGAGASFAIKTLSLRGLAGDQLLVLVNGKRRHNSATLFINGTTQNGQSPPDLDLIPSNMIERIEVLRDGASAQYGSDAIAGVANFITRSTFTGFEFQGDYNFIDGSDDNYSLSGLAGFELGDSGNLVFGAGWQHRSELGTPKRDFVNVGYETNPSAYSALATPGLFAVSYFDTGTGTVNTQIRPDVGCTDLGGTVDVGRCYFTYVPFDNITEDENRYQAFAELTVDLSDTIRFQADDVREFQSRNSTGVRGIRLAEGDDVISLSILHKAGIADQDEREDY